MATAKRSSLFTAGVVLVLGGVAAMVVVLVLALPSGGPLHRYAPWFSSSQSTFNSLGERIFLTGTDENGNTIPRSQNGGMMTAAVACVDCHARDGKGRTISMMMGRYKAHDIRWSALTSGQHEDDEEWVPYDEGSFARAVRDGIEPNGENLEFPMPRWQLTDAEVAALIEYLKTL